MPQSLEKILVHIVFSTEQRKPLLSEEIRSDLYRYIAGILKQLESLVIEIGGTSDHVHILCSITKNLAPSKIIEEMKKSSSKWVKTKGREYGNFYWQRGYGIFSVSQSNIEEVGKYIIKQIEHHRKMSFQEEFRRLLERHGIQFDERYVWD
jgi:REP element-mobilizing transposase RayT